jgi:chemotaxis protein CheY-P-specific phosphatase CheC
MNWISVNDVKDIYLLDFNTTMANGNYILEVANIGAGHFHHLLSSHTEQSQVISMSLISRVDGKILSHAH